LNETPSSVTVSVSAREKTWNPPESVRMGPGQFMNEWSPPARWTMSAPGRRYRWYALASTTWAPIPASWSGVTPLTVPRVPTGMKTGVTTVPWVVVKVDRRAAVPRSRAVTSKSKGCMVV
jgi:hypothetical protein